VFDFFFFQIGLFAQLQAWKTQRKPNTTEQSNQK